MPRDSDAPEIVVCDAEAPARATSGGVKSEATPTPTAFMAATLKEYTVSVVSPEALWCFKDGDPLPSYTRIDGVPA